MEYTIVTICGLVTLFGLAITVRCILAQKRIHWLSPSTKPVHDDSKINGRRTCVAFRSADPGGHLAIWDTFISCDARSLYSQPAAATCWTKHVWDSVCKFLHCPANITFSPVESAALPIGCVCWYMLYRASSFLPYERSDFMARTYDQG